MGPSTSGSALIPPPSALSSELRVFISSTFRDLLEEREHLAKKIFPEIRALCRERGITFTEVDLRWGLTDEEAALGRVIRTCLEEIDRCRPYFFGITGERYGYIPDLHEIYKDPDLLKLYPWIEDAAMEGASIIDLEFRHAALNRGAGVGVRGSERRDEPERVAGDEQSVAGCRFFFRKGRARLASADLPRDRWTRDEGDEDRARLDGLKDRVRQAGFSVEEFRDPASLGEMIYDELVEIINRDFADARPPSPLDMERARHTAFAASRRHAYIPSQAYLKRLNEWVDSNEPPLVIFAESGSGKSALLSFWCDSLRRKRPDTFVVEHYVGIGAADTDHYALMRHVIEEIRERFSRTEPVPSSLEEIARGFGVWLGYASDESRARGQRMVLVLDGLNQLDGDALKLLWLPDVIAPEIRLVLSSTIEQSLLALSRRGWPELGMQPLSEAEREAVVVRYLSEYHKALSVDQVKRIAGDIKCAHPLFLKTLLEELRLHGEHERLGRELERLLETTGTEHLFQRVLERLEDDYSSRAVREVMSYIWCSRQGLSEIELAELTGMSRMKLSALVLGLDYHMVRREGTLDFFHDYLRRAVEKRYLADDQRKHDAHMEIARYFDEKPPGERTSRELAFQLREAGEEKQLAEMLSTIEHFMVLTNSGESRYEVLGYWAAMAERQDIVDHYLRGLDRWRSAAHDEVEQEHVLSQVAGLMAKTGQMEASLRLERERLALALQYDNRIWEASTRLRLAQLARERGEYDDAENELSTARTICEELENHHGIADVLGTLGVIRRKQGRYAEALELYREQLKILRDLGYRHGQASPLINMGNVHGDRAEYDEAIRRYREGIAICRESGNRTWLANGLGGIANVLADRGDYDEALAIYREQEEIHRSLGDRTRLATTLGGIGNVLRHRSRYEEALAVFREQEEICRDIGNRAGVAIAVSSQGNIHFGRRDYDRAIDCYRQAESIARSIADKRTLGNILNSIGVIYRNRGDYENALRYLRQQEEIAREIGNRDGLALVLGNIGNVHRDRGEIEEALGYYRQQVAIAREIDNTRLLATAMENTGMAYYNAGDYDRAIECHRQQEAIAREQGNMSGLVASLCNQGLAFESLGRYDESLECYRQAVPLCSTDDYLPLEATIMGNMAIVHSRREEYQMALDLLRNAIDINRGIENRGSLAHCLEDTARILLEILARSDEMPSYLEPHIQPIVDGDWRASTLVAARAAAVECYSVSQKLLRTATLLPARVLLARIDAIEGNTDAALHSLLDLIDDAPTDRYRAEARYWIWKLRLGDDADTYGAEALALYRTLVVKSPRADYRKRIEELEQEVSSTAGGNS